MENVFSGYHAGFSNTTGYANAFLGYLAGAANTTGSQNAFSGFEAGLRNTTGSGNTFDGYGAGNSNSTGNQNTFSGWLAGNANTTGSYNTFYGAFTGTNSISAFGNTFVGGSTGAYNTTGSDNSFFGGGAGGSNTTGYYNTFLGYGAGGSNTTGTNNTVIGHQAGYFSNANSNIFIGLHAGYNNTTGGWNVYIANVGPASGNESNTIRIGDPASQTAAYIAGIYGNAPSAALPVVVNASGQLGTSTRGIGVTSFNGRTGAVVPAVNDYSFSQLSGTLGSSQLSGTYTNPLTLNNAANSFSGSFTGNGTGLTGVLPAGGSPNYIQNGTALQTADFNISGGGSANSFNSATNYQLRGKTVVNAPQDSNLFLGVGAGQNNQATYYGNVFAGNQAGYSNTTGNGNVFVGYLAGNSNTTGQGNAFIGTFAGGNNTIGGSNIFIGEYSGANNTTGSYNVFTGLGAGHLNTGSYNTFYGGTAGSAHRTGDNNTMIGYTSGVQSGTGSWNNFFGANSGAGNQTGNNNIYIGNSGCGYPCSEDSTIRIGGNVGNPYGPQTATYIAGIYGSTSSGGVAVYINSAGQLGTLTSSRRFKEQIRDMGDSTNALMKLRPVTYFYKPEYDKGPRTLQYGLIAEEVAEVYPELVAYQEDGKPYTVKYQYLTTMLLNELQKEHRKVEELKAELQVQNAELKKQNEQLEQRLMRVEALLQSQVNSAVAQTASEVSMQPEGNRK